MTNVFTIALYSISFVTKWPRLKIAIAKTFTMLYVI